MLASSPPTAAAGPPVFKFSRDTYSVRVENIPESVGRHEIKELFCNLIGEVRRCEERISDEQGRFMELTFYTRDASKKALCMSGYTVAGTPLRVIALCPPNSARLATHARQMDGRRNLYVLGLPFDLTKNEFTEYFSRYGTVTHSVILATVDNASRRRGFVVMSSHDEAKAAMAALSRTDIKGHTIDVSWAVVQRSQGFLDGGDRSVALNNRPSSPSSTQEPATTRESSPESPTVSAVPVPSPIPSVTASPPTTLLVSNLPTLLFSQTIDLQPLFCPFGDIKRLEILQAGAADIEAGKLSVVLEYGTPQMAKEAMHGLHGQVYAGFRVDVKLIESTADGAGSKSSLNPSASAFVYSVTPSSPEHRRTGSRGYYGAHLPSSTFYPPSGLWPNESQPISRPNSAIGRAGHLGGEKLLMESFGRPQRPQLRARWSSMPNVFDALPNTNIPKTPSPLLA